MGYASPRFKPHLAQVSNTPTPTAIHSSGAGRTRTDDASYTTGKGGADPSYKKTAHVMFFCATNPDAGANGSVWALLPNGAVQRLGEVKGRGDFEEPPAYTDV